MSSTINSHSNEQPTASPSPKQLISMTIELYDSTRRDLMRQGYPAALADKLARDYVTKQ